MSLVRLIDRGAGIGMVVGAAGTGKTLLCRLLAEQFRSQFMVVVLSSGRLATRAALLKVILRELGQPYRDLDEGELRLSLLDHLEPSPRSRRGLLLLIDKAQALPWRLLEEVRMITNLVRDSQPRVRVVLAGNSLLEERFADPKLDSFNQRLAARCYLEAFNRAETADYVRSQVAAAGGEPAHLFADDALAAVHRVTEGVPRLINQLCDHAMILSGLGGHARVTCDAIEEAWADLQQLPKPAPRAQDSTTGATSVVEFGQLDELPTELPEAIPFRSPSGQQFAMATPEERLDTIEDQLSHIDDEFQPAGSIGTEVDLDFPEFGDPLSEDFAEEEVVLDHYGRDREPFADAPRSRQLGRR